MPGLARCMLAVVGYKGGHTVLGIVSMTCHLNGVATATCICVECVLSQARVARPGRSVVYVQMKLRRRRSWALR